MKLCLKFEYCLNQFCKNIVLAKRRVKDVYSEWYCIETVEGLFLQFTLCTLLNVFNNE